jgi:hypothetical protein
MRKRLEELNWQTQAHSLNHGDHGEAGFKPGEVISTTVLLRVQKPKKTA